MAGLYLVGAWLVVQVAGTILPMFGAPAWVARTVVILLAIGLVPALVISWAFELTPEGLKRDSEVTNAESIAPHTARRMDRLIIILMAVALSYFAVDKFVLALTRDASGTPQASALPERTRDTQKIERVDTRHPGAKWVSRIPPTKLPGGVRSSRHKARTTTPGTAVRGGTRR